MPRKTEIQAEENVINSPLRRSSRKTVGVSPAPAPLTARRNSQSNIETTEVSKPVKARRSSLSQENPEKNVNTESKPATRGRRASVSKEETEEHNTEPIRTRGRRLSTSSETSVKEEKQTVAKRRNSVTSEEHNESENVDPTLKPVRGRRGSVKEDEIKEETSTRTLRSRRNSATDKEDIPDTETKGRKGTRSRRSSIDNAEEPEAKTVKLTPVKSRRRLSVSENVVNLEPIEEQSEIVKGRKSKSPVDENKSTIRTLTTVLTRTPVKKNKPVESISSLDLSVIDESSFTDETSTDSQQTVILGKKSLLSPQSSKNKSEINQSTPKKSPHNKKDTVENNSNYLEVSSDKLLLSPRKSPRLNKEFDIKKSPIPKMMDLGSHITDEIKVDELEIKVDSDILNKELDRTDSITRCSEVIESNEIGNEPVVECESEQKINSNLQAIGTEQLVNVEPEQSIKVTLQNNEDVNEKLQADNLEKTNNSITLSEKLEDEASNKIETENSPDGKVKNTETFDKLNELNKDDVIAKPVSIDENPMSKREMKEQLNSISNETNLKHDNPNISTGSDGSVKFHLNVSIANTKAENVQEHIEELESKINTSNNSDSSNKENVESSQKLTTVEIEEKDTIIGNVLDDNGCQGITVEAKREVVARVSNVFRPKMKENSFMEPMEVDEFPSFLNNTQQKMLPDLNESSSDIVSSAKLSPLINKNVINEENKDLDAEGTVETFTIDKKLNRQNSVESTEGGSVDDSFKLDSTIEQENQTEEKLKPISTELLEETVDSINLNEERSKEHHSDSCVKLVDPIAVSENSSDVISKSIATTPEKDFQLAVPESSNISLRKSLNQTSENTNEGLEENKYVNVQSDKVNINSPRQQSFKTDNEQDVKDMSDVKVSQILEKENSEEEYEGTNSPVNYCTKVTPEKTNQMIKLNTSEYNQKSDEVPEDDVSNLGTHQEIEEYSEELRKSSPSIKADNSKLDEVEGSLKTDGGISKNAEITVDDYEFNIPSDEELEMPRNEELKGDGEKEVSIDIMEETSISNTLEQNTVISKIKQTKTSPEIEKFNEQEVDIIEDSSDSIQHETIGTVTDVAEKEVSSNSSTPSKNRKNNTEHVSKDNSETTSNRICFIKIENFDIKKKTCDTVVNEPIETEKVDNEKSKKKKSKSAKQTLEENLLIEDNIEITEESQNKVDIITDIQVDNENGQKKKSTSLIDLVNNSGDKTEINDLTSNSEIVDVDNIDAKKSIGAIDIDLENKPNDKSEEHEFTLSSEVGNEFIHVDNKDTKTKKIKSKTTNLKNKTTNEKEIDVIEEEIDGTCDVEETQNKSEDIKKLKTPKKTKSVKSNINKEMDTLCGTSENVEISMKKSKKIKKTENAEPNVNYSQNENANLVSNESNNFLKKNKRKCKNIVSADATSNKKERNISQFEGMDEITKLKLDEYLSKNLPKMRDEKILCESSDSEESDEVVNEFICDEAEEGEEDTPSEGSNDIIDDGESINTTESELESDEEYDENDSFICNDEAEQLLSGEEYDLEYDGKQPEKASRKSRIIPLYEFEGDVIKIKKKEKPVKKKKKSRIIVISDSSEDENVENLKNKTKNSVEDLELSAIPPEEPKYTEDIINEKSKSTTSDMDNNYESDIKSDLFGSSQNTSNTESETMQTSRKTKRKSLITVHENISVSEIKDSALSERINLLVDSFCTKIRKGEISMNLSLEYADKDSREATSEKGENDKVVEEQIDPIQETSKKGKNTDAFHISKSLSTKKSGKFVYGKEDRKEITKSPVFPTTSKGSKRQPRDNSFSIEDEDFEEIIPKKKAKRLSVSVDDTELTNTKKINKKRRLSKSLESLETTDKPNKKNRKKLRHDIGTFNLESNKKVKSPNKKGKRRRFISSEDELRTKSLNLMNQLITDVKNRSIRTIKPSSGGIDLNSSWITDVVDIKPSTTIVKKEELNNRKLNKMSKVHPKDFRTQMLYDSSRIKRIDTKKLMKMKGVYF